jgi:putative transposase
MPRIARAVAPGFPHHVVQRGNNRTDVFLSPEDREVYLYLVKSYSEKWGAPVICYCLMTNHVHLLVKPSSELSLQKMMQGVTLCYTQHINRKYERTGRLWESRYHSSIVDQENYLWSVARYIEQNPVRAALVKYPEDYPYSSAAAHLKLLPDPVLGDQLFPAGRQKDYSELMNSDIPKDELTLIRKSVKSGRPIGADKFVREMELKINKRLSAMPTGRPRKTSSAGER